MARHLSKKELFAELQSVSRLRKTRESSPFTTMAIISNYVLWKSEKYTQGKLAKYNQLVAEYYAKIDRGEVTKEYMSDRLMDKVGWTCHSVDFTINDYKKENNKLLRQLTEKMVEVDNDISRAGTLYNIVFFNVLMDCGYGKVRLNRVNEAIGNLYRYLEVENKKVVDLHHELINKVGIFIEMPKC